MADAAKKGYIHVYCGDGKGKTTAAVGLAVRAAGRGARVLVVRFLKNEDSGEVPVLRQIPGITVVPCGRTFGFVFQMTEEQKEEAAAYFTEHFRAAVREAEAYDLLILDELAASCRYGMVPEEEVEAFLKQRPEQLEVVITGREPSERLIRLADYVSEICMRRHPFTKGVAAREGIEY